MVVGYQLIRMVERNDLTNLGSTAPTSYTYIDDTTGRQLTTTSLHVSVDAVTQLVARTRFEKRLSNGIIETVWHAD